MEEIIEKLKTRKVTVGGQMFTVVPVFTRKSDLRGIPLLRRVRELVLAEPKRINMAVAQVRLDDQLSNRAFNHVGEEFRAREYVKEFPPCNTVGCVAGWGDAVVLGGTPLDFDERTWPEVEERATNYFEFEEYGVNGDELYFVENWPYDLKEKYAAAEKANDHEAMAEATAERITRIIAEMEENGRNE
jgi:hypothetical protein